MSNSGNVKDDDGYGGSDGDCDDDVIDGEEGNTEDITLGAVVLSMGVKEASDWERRRLERISARLADGLVAGMAVPAVDKVIGDKRKAKAPVNEKDHELTEEESKSPWTTNKNPTGWGDAADVVANWRANAKQKETDEAIVEKALKQAAGEGMMSIDVKVDMKDHVILPAEVVKRLLPGIAKRLQKEDKK